MLNKTPHRRSQAFIYRVEYEPMSLMSQIASHPDLISALDRWKSPGAVTDVDTLGRAIRELNLGFPDDFLNAQAIGRVMSIAGVRRLHTNKGNVYLDIRPR